MRHLTEDTLIQYQFDLLSDGKRQQAAEHLRECADCRQALGALQEKFGVLDVLGAQEAVSEELLAKTVGGVRQTPSAGWKPALPWRPLLAAAAAVLVVGVLWVQRPGEKAEEASGVVAMGAKEEVAATRSYAMKEETLVGADALSEAPGPRLRGDDGGFGQLGAAKTGADAVLHALGPRLRGDDSVVRFVKAEEIADRPPFAPASAIELVVLPGPEAMQVTIYNAADLTLVRDTRRLVLKPGWNWLQFMWAGTKIDPTSLSLRPLEHADKVSIEQLVYPATAQ
jgi:hypothetical protein